MPNEGVLLLKNFFLNFTSIVYEAMPFIVLGAVIAGVLEEMVPQRFLARIIPRNRYLAMLIGGLLGLIFPMCECGIIPVMRRLLRKGLPLSTCTAYLLAGPIVNFIVITSTMVAFSAKDQDVGAAKGTYPMPGLLVVGLRVGLGYLVAIVTSVLVERLWQREGTKLLMPLAMPRPSDADQENGPRRTAWQKLSNISETALHDFVDITAFLVLGALLSSFARLWLSEEQIAQLGSSRPVLAILVMMGLAIVLCLCSEADAFVAASFTTLSGASKLAFLVLGPMMDLKLYFMYTRVFRSKLIWTIFGSVMVQVFVYTVITHYVWVAWARSHPPTPVAPSTAAAAQADAQP